MLVGLAQTRAALHTSLLTLLAPNLSNKHLPNNHHILLQIWYVSYSQRQRAGAADQDPPRPPHLPS